MGNEIAEIVVMNYSISITAIIFTIIAIVFKILKYRSEMRKFMKLLGLEFTKLNRKLVNALKKYIKRTKKLIIAELSTAFYQLATKSKDTTLLTQFVSNIENVIKEYLEGIGVDK